MKKIGLIVNPLAGSAEMVEPAVLEALSQLLTVQDEFVLITYPGPMGENLSLKAGLAPQVIGSLQNDVTTSEDTKRAARDLIAAEVELLVFAGGDTTARDLLEAVGSEFPVMGIPASPEVHSSVYAANPEEAGKLAAYFIHGIIFRTSHMEVIDEDSARYPKLYGFMKTMNGFYEEDHNRSIAEKLVAEMQPGRLYILGNGTAQTAIAGALGIDRDPMSIDVIKDRKLVAANAGEDEILALLNGEDATIILTIIGREGHILGRGNESLTPAVISRVGPKNIQVVAIQDRIVAVPKVPGLPERYLRVDTGDPETDKLVRGYTRVITCRNEQLMLKIV